MDSDSIFTFIVIAFIVLSGYVIPAINKMKGNAQGKKRRKPLGELIPMEPPAGFKKQKKKMPAAPPPQPVMPAVADKPEEPTPLPAPQKTPAPRPVFLKSQKDLVRGMWLREILDKPLALRSF